MDLKIILFLTEILHHEKKKKKKKKTKTKKSSSGKCPDFLSVCLNSHCIQIFFFISFFYLIVINTAYKL